MIISLHALRQEEEKRRQQEEASLQTVNRFGLFPWQRQTEPSREGILKFARYLANT